MVLFARDIVEKEFLSLTEDTTILEGARAMKSRRRGFVVVGSPSAPRGIVTEWDIVEKIVAEGRDPKKVTLGEIMSTEILSVDAGAGLAAVSQLMSERGVRRVIVRDEGNVVGFITSKTMLRRMNEYVDKVSAQISRLQTPWF